MQTSDLHVKWQVSLSNGETFLEGKEPFNFKDGEPLPFARLEKYLVENKLKITSIALTEPETNRTWNLPGMANRPKFRAFDSAPQPYDYHVFRKMAQDVGTGSIDEEGKQNIVKYDIPKNVEVFTVAEAVYKGGVKLQLWVSESNPDNSWILAVGGEA